MPQYDMTQAEAENGFVTTVATVTALIIKLLT